MRHQDIALFLDIARLGAISKAAHKHNLSVANVSNALIRLEKFLGVKLFIRTTRQLRLSTKGRDFLPHAKALVTQYDRALATVKDIDSLSGHLNITAPSDFGRNILSCWIDEFLQQHPKLSCHLDLNDLRSDLYRENIDVAIRYGIPNEPDLIHSPLISPIHRIVCASPKYLEQVKPIETIEDLKRHKTLLLTINDNLESIWHLYNDKQQFSIDLSSQYNSNDAAVIHQWALQGRGIMFKAYPDVAEDLYQHRLVRLLADYKSAATTLSFISLERPQSNIKIKALRDFLATKCAQQDWLVR